MAIITTKQLDFLKQLKENNNRDWFNEHKTEFQQHQAAVKQFYEDVKENLETHDAIEKLKLFRIYRDVRFSADKTPYKPHFAGSFSRLGAELRGGYYLRIRPGESFIACGFWNPNKEDLFRIRKEWEVDATELYEILANEKFNAIWGSLQGDEVKTAPKGFDKTHPNINVIKKKQFLFSRSFSDAEVVSNDFSSKIDESYRAIRPFFNLMSSVLTTNLNGESLI